MEKICKTCKISKDSSMFFKSTYIKGGFNYSCKSCCDISRRLWQKTNPDKYKKQVERSSTKNKLAERRLRILARKKVYYELNKVEIYERLKEYLKSEKGIAKRKARLSIYEKTDRHKELRKVINKKKHIKAKLNISPTYVQRTLGISSKLLNANLDFYTSYKEQVKLNRLLTNKTTKND